MEGKWLSVLEFASYKKKSISTVRRSIKANRVKFKEDNGKYFIWAKDFKVINNDSEKDLLEMKFEFERLKKENMELRNEAAEMKMLITLYENGQMLHKPQLPELPLNI
jgi:phage terminase Nu1 subunit (DNA packaging protein)